MLFELIFILLPGEGNCKFDNYSTLVWNQCLEYKYMVWNEAKCGLWTTGFERIGSTDKLNTLSLIYAKMYDEQNCWSFKYVYTRTDVLDSWTINTRSEQLISKKNIWIIRNYVRDDLQNCEKSTTTRDFNQKQLNVLHIRSCPQVRNCFVIDSDFDAIQHLLNETSPRLNIIQTKSITMSHFYGRTRDHRSRYRSPSDERPRRYDRRDDGYERDHYQSNRRTSPSERRRRESGRYESSRKALSPRLMK